MWWLLLLLWTLPGIAQMEHTRTIHFFSIISVNSVRAVRWCHRKIWIFIKKAAAPNFTTEIDERSSVSMLDMVDESTSCVSRLFVLQQLEDFFHCDSQSVSSYLQRIPLTSSARRKRIKYLLCSGYFTINGLLFDDGTFCPFFIWSDNKPQYWLDYAIKTTNPYTFRIFHSVYKTNTWSTLYSTGFFISLLLLSSTNNIENLQNLQFYTIYDFFFYCSHNNKNQVVSSLSIILVNNIIWQFATC